MFGFHRPIRDRRRSGQPSAVCGRGDGSDVVVDGMVRQADGKSDHYVVELVIPEPLDAVRRNLPF